MSLANVALESNELAALDLAFKDLVELDRQPQQTHQLAKYELEHLRSMEMKRPSEVNPKTKTKLARNIPTPMENEHQAPKRENLDHGCDLENHAFLEFLRGRVLQQIPGGIWRIEAKK